MPSIAPNGKSQYGRGLIEGSWNGMKITIGKVKMEEFNNEVCAY